MLAKLQVYGFSKESIRWFLIYLINHTQRIKIDSTFSDWTNILKGIRQGSILGPLLFNIFINNLFFFSAKCEICHFADNNSLYFCGINLDNKFTNLIEDMLHVYEWFVYDSMAGNPDKFPRKQRLTKAHRHCKSVYNHKISLYNRKVSSVALLVITIDSKLNFKEHVNNIIKATYLNLYALRRLRKFLT